MGDSEVTSKVVLLVSGTAWMPAMLTPMPVMWETWLRSLGWEDPLEKGTATHSSLLAWRIPWTVYPRGHKGLDMTERLSLYFFPS